MALGLAIPILAGGSVLAALLYLMGQLDAASVSNRSAPPTLPRAQAAMRLGLANYPLRRREDLVSEHLQHFFAVLAQLRVSYARNAKQIGDILRAGHCDRVEGGVVEDHVRGDAGRSGGFQAPPSQAIQRL